MDGAFHGTVLWALPLLLGVYDDRDEGRDFQRAVSDLYRIADRAQLFLREA